MTARPAPPPRLHAALAARIRHHLAQTGAEAGHRLVEEELCRHFAVSRTPVRGALKLLAQDGVLTPRPGRGYVLAALRDALAAARQQGTLADTFTQQDILRRFAARPPVAARVLAQLTELSLLQRRPGHGWVFTGDSARLLQESYAFRRALEPALLLLPGFRLDRAWAGRARAAHMALRARPLRAGDGARFHALNADFHEQLARCCANRHMRHAIERQIELRRFLSWRWNYPSEQIHKAIDEHLEILAALEQGYADKASALMLHHLTQSATSSAAAG